jgi:O-methyltransferase
VRSYYTHVRPQLKRLRARLGIRSSRTRSLKIPPDFDEATAHVVNTVSEFTMTSPERIEALVNSVRYVVANDIGGDFVECGVWRGGSSMALALTLRQLGDESRFLYLYDTFEGMSAPTDEDVSIDARSAAETFAERRLSEDSSEWCRSPIEEVKENLASTGYPIEKMHFIKGKVENTIPAHMPVGKLAILRLDTDWYESTRHELEHLYPRLVSGGILIIDDYGHWAGARKAVDDYIAQHGLRLFLNRVDYTARSAIKP